MSPPDRWLHHIARIGVKNRCPLGDKVIIWPDIQGLNRQPRHGQLLPDWSCPGLELELKQEDTEKFLAWQHLNG